MASDGLEGNDAYRRIMDRFAEDRETAERVRRHQWAGKSNRMKAEALIAKVDPDLVRESDMPRIALAQAHATLALLDFHRGVPEGVIGYERTGG